MLDPEGGLLRGTLDVLILKAVSWGPRHGYAVAEWVKQVTEEELLVEEGPLYTALHRLEKKGWLTSEWGFSENNRRAKYYQLTSEGRQIIANIGDQMSDLSGGWSEKTFKLPNAFYQLP
jgi:transcriptional regulator